MFTVISITGVEPTVLPQSGGRTIGSTRGMLATVTILADLGGFLPQSWLLPHIFFCQNRPKSAKIFTVTSIPVVERSVLLQSSGRTVGSTTRMLGTAHILADLGTSLSRPRTASHRTHERNEIEIEIDFPVNRGNTA